MNAHRRLQKTFDIHAVQDTLEEKGIPYKRVGAEIEADVDGTGHLSFKINPSKGLYFSTTGGKGTVASLLRRIGATASTGASAPARPAAGGHKAEHDTSGIARQIWQSAWTCTHSDDMPDGWGKGLNAAQKSAVRVKHETARDIVIAYLTQRFGPDHVEHWLRQVRITRDKEHRVMMLAPMLKSGQVSGVQRTFFDDNGQKSERKMLGPHGVKALTPPPVVLPRDLGVGKCLLLAEGFETTAAAAQAAGWGGICAYDAGGMVKWAEEQAQTARNLNAEQISQAPAVVVLVDRDKSQVGQDTASRVVVVLRAAGLRAFYAIPPTPESGGPRGGAKGSDWGDYPREGFSNEVLAAHLALSIANSDRNMPGTDEPAQVTGQNRAWRESATPTMIADTADVEDVRREQKIHILSMIDDYLAWFQSNKEERQENPFKPWLFSQTTGVGKTSEIMSLTRHIDLRQSGARVCVGVDSHQQAEPFEQDGWFHFYGRADPGDVASGKRPACAECPNFQEMSKAQEKNHVAQAEFCRSCSNGLAWSILAAQREIDDGATDVRETKLQDRIRAHQETLRFRGLDWRSVEPCSWQDHLRDAISAQFIVMCSSSYSHSVVGDALWITDEHFNLSKSTKIGLSDISEWAGKTQRILGHERDLLAQSDGEDADRLRDRIVLLESTLMFFQMMADRLASIAGQGGEGGISIDADLRDAVQRILDAAKATSRSGLALAGWEALSFSADGTLAETPLRAAAAIAESLAFGDGHVDEGHIIVASSEPVIERVKIGLPTVIMDATPDPVVLDIVKQRDGAIIRLIAKQNVRIIRYPTRFWGLNPLNPKAVGPDRVKRELTKYRAMIQTFPDAAILMHKRAVDALEMDQKSGEPIVGYWGRDHRAHNRWSGRDLVIIGSFFPPMSTWRNDYQCARIAALAGGCSACDWPLWNDDMQMQTDVWLTECEQEVRSHLPLPSNLVIRRWLLSRIVAEIVQAIGRARAANSTREICVRIFGGVPLFGLGDYGLKVSEYADDPEELGVTIDQHMHDMRELHLSAIEKCDTLASRLIARGEAVTRDAMTREIDAINALIEEAFDDAEMDESYSWGGGYNHISTPPRIEKPHVQAPDSSVVKEWIALRMPILCEHMSAKGQNGGLVKAARSASREFGEKMVKSAMILAETMMRRGLSVDAMSEFAWQIIEYASNAKPEDIIAARFVLEAIGTAENVALPWTDEKEAIS